MRRQDSAKKTSVKKRERKVFEDPMKIAKQDQPYIRELSKHVQALIASLKNYREHQGTPECVRDAYRALCEDQKSANRLERDLASAIISLFDNFILRVKIQGRPYTAHSFLFDYTKGKVKEQKIIDQAIDNISDNLGFAVLNLCTTEGIERLYKK
jgi:hypothetical protein